MYKINKMKYVALIEVDIEEPTTQTDPLVNCNRL